MREESHLDEMRSAIRGDFERLAERRGEQELLRVGENESKSPPTAEPDSEQSAADPELEQPHRSWLVRFLSP